MLAQEFSNGTCQTPELRAARRKGIAPHGLTTCFHLLVLAHDLTTVAESSTSLGNEIAAALRPFARAYG